MPGAAVGLAAGALVEVGALVNAGVGDIVGTPGSTSLAAMVGAAVTVFVGCAVAAASVG